MSRKPEFSVVIATYGRPTKLRRCLAGLARLRTPLDAFEVIVVDDGSPQPVKDALKGEIPPGLQITILRQENAGPGIARNTGVTIARGRWIASIDDDCIPHPLWLERLASALRKHPDHMIGGGIINGYPNSLFDSASWALLDFLYEYLARTPTAPRFFVGMNMALSRAAFDEISGFDPQRSYLAEDRDICDRWADQGRHFYYAPGAAIRHYHGLTFRKFWRQHSKYGRGAREFHLARANRQQDRPRIEPLGFYFGLVTHPLCLKGPITWRLALVGCMVLSQVAMVAGYAREVLRGK